MKLDVAYWPARFGRFRMFAIRSLWGQTGLRDRAKMERMTQERRTASFDKCFRSSSVADISEITVRAEI
jgi:predicted CoA-binding protein